MNIKTKLQIEKRQPQVAPLAEADPYRQRIAEVFHRIATRAFERFAQRGFQEGHDLADWLAAESELFRKVPCEVAEKGNEIMVRVELPGFNERDVEVKVEADRLYITGHKEKVVQSNTDGRRLDERDYRDVFRILSLPSRVVPEQATANLHEGVLTVFAPKEVEPKSQADVA